jgi:hypothetical protein
MPSSQVMHKYKTGKLRSGSGGKVTNPSIGKPGAPLQAILHVLGPQCRKIANVCPGFEGGQQLVHLGLGQMLSDPVGIVRPTSFCATGRGASRQQAGQ